MPSISSTSIRCPDWLQVVIKLPGGGKCHPGPADVVRLEQGGSRVISAGAGGWLRVWDTSSLADTEPAEGGLTAEVEPLAQVCHCTACSRHCHHAHMGKYSWRGAAAHLE
jgi:hypothetical protein